MVHWLLLPAWPQSIKVQKPAFMTKREHTPQKRPPAPTCHGLGSEDEDGTTKCVRAEMNGPPEHVSWTLFPVHVLVSR